MKNFPRISLVAVMIALLACSFSGQGSSVLDDGQTKKSGSAGQDTQPGLLGSVRRESDTVEHGASADVLKQVIDEVTFFAGDVLRVRDGGEGLLDFSDGMLLRLFNDTQMNVVAIESDPGSPIDVQMFLEEGGFTGELSAAGGRAVFETPGGAEITVLGTDFFIVYDSANKLTYAGNFGGQVEVAGAGQNVTLNDGSYVEVPDGGPPSLPIPMTIDRSEFETVARREKSLPPAVAASATWQLLIRYESELAVSGDLVNAEGNNLHVWTGEFAVNGGSIDGSGDVLLEGYSWCPNGFEVVQFDWSGSGTFNITGSVVDGPNGPAFDVYFAGEDLELSEPPCPSAAVLSALDRAWGSLQTNWELDGELIVDAREGATLEIEDMASDDEMDGFYSDGRIAVSVGASQ